MSFVKTLKNIWSIEDLRKRILYTLGLILIFRAGTYVVLPGINPTTWNAAIDAQGGVGGLLGLFDIFAGGAFSRASIFSLGIMPYISASIVMQLLTMVYPPIQKLQREGESGRRKVNQWTRYLTIVVTGFQAVAYSGYVRGTAPEAVLVNPMIFWLSCTIILIAGTLFVMWLGEKITDNGIGNGISLLIMAGIIASLPSALIAELVFKMGNGQLVTFVIEIGILVVIVIACIALVQATRKVPVQYAKRMVGRQMRQGARQYIPLKVNAAGVMPIIFAQALMFVPVLFVNQIAFFGSFSDIYSIPYNIVFFLFVIIFTYFYTALQTNPQQMSEDIKKNGGFIPGVKPGRKTADFLDTILSRITLPGSIFLGFVAIMPAIVVRLIGVSGAFAMFYGGTSLLIMVGVVLDTLQQVESHLLMRHYDGLVKSGRVKGRTRVSSGM